MTHIFYVTMSYGMAALIVAGLIGWVMIDGRARKRELAELEAAGIRRRSAASPAQKANGA